MTAVRGARGGLAAQIVRVTLLVGAVTFVGVTIALIISVSRIATAYTQSQDQRVIQSLTDTIESRLRNVGMVLDQAIAHAFMSDTEKPADMILLAFGSNRNRIEAMVIADGDGRVLASAPERIESVESEPPFVQARAGNDGYSVVRPDEGGWELWLTRTTIGPDGEPIVVMARLQTAFVEQGVADAAEGLDEYCLLVLGPERSVLASDTEYQASLADARWSPRGPTIGTVWLPGDEGETLEGEYAEVGLLQGLDWRIVLAHPRTTRVAQVLDIIGPPVLVILVGGAVALVLAWGLAVRLVRPLKELERAALAAASGAYVRPITNESEDEIGQVAAAFNAVSLRLNALHDIAQLLASASQLDQVLDGILAAVGHLVGPGSAAVYLLEDGETFVPVRTRGPQLANAERIDAAASAWLSSALATNDPVEFRGEGEELCKELPGFIGDKVEAVAAPLVAGQAELGVVVVTRDADRPLLESEREMLKTFSAQAAVAVRTSRLFEVETMSRKTAEALRHVAEELVRPVSLEGALRTVEGIVSDLFGATASAIVLVDRQVLGLSAAALPQRDAQVLAVAYRVLGSSRAEGGVVVGRGTDDAVDQLIDQWECDQLLVVPVALETNHGGVMLVGLTQAIGKDRMRVGEALADEIALALDNAYFFQRALTRAANLETIFKISQAVGSSLQVNVVLNRVLDVVQKILSADAVALMSYDRKSRKLKTAMARGNLPAGIMDLRLAPGEDVPGQVFNRGEPVALRDLQPRMGGLAGMAAVAGLRAMLAVPLLARGRSIGVLTVFSVQPGVFVEEDVSVLQTFASQAALAIDTARLYSREHEVAAVLQQSILPDELPDFPEIEAGSVYEPAGREAEIGGDYYDVFRSADAIWFAMGDVCGKGVHAATKTSMIKYAVRAFVTAGYSPSRVMADVNNMIAETGDTSDIVTLWIGRYDPKSGSLTWADGGHPPGLLRRADGSVESLGVTGALLGAITGAPYEESTISIGVGDTLLLYTDGVTEARRGNVFFGEDRVRRALRDVRSAQDCADKLLAAVHAFVQGDLRDDVAVLVLRPRERAATRKKGRSEAG